MSDLGSEKTGKAAFDPGWNDPPPVTFNPQVQKPRNLLNKRVAFPLSTTPSNSAVSSIPTGCPLPVVTPPSVPVTVLPKDKEEITFDSDNALRDVCDILSGVLDISEELASNSNDIRRRLKIMEDSWENGKFNKQAQLKILKLSLALKEGRPREADALHKALAVEHAGAVGAWLPAVRRLVASCTARHDLLSIDTDQPPDS